MSTPEIRLEKPDGPEALDAARAILREYADSLGIDLCFQGFEAEMAGLPGDYAEPGGALLLAYVDGELAGCGAMRPLADVDYANACEMKRLYVRRAFRRFGLGRILAEALLDTAAQAGYSVMLLGPRALRLAGLRGDPALLLQPYPRGALPESRTAGLHHEVVMPALRAGPPFTVEAGWRPGRGLPRPWPCRPVGAAGRRGGR